MLEDIKGVLDASTEMSNNLKRESAKIMNFLKIALIEREIEDLRMFRYNCQGCFTEHPNQDQHMCNIVTCTYACTDGRSTWSK